MSEEYTSINKPDVPNFHCECEKMMCDIDRLATV
jgi:hypothetical protein